MERGVLEEDVHDQAPADLGVHDVARGDDVLQGILVLDEDEGAGLLRGHLAAGLRDLLQGAGVHVAVLLPAGEDPLQEGLLLQRAAGRAAHRAEEAPHLRLEDDDQGHGAHVDEGAQQRGDHLHAEGFRDDADHDHDDDGDEDVDGGRPADPAEYEIDDGCNHQDVEDIDP